MANASTNDVNTIAVMAPKDADGRKVPLDTKVLYDRHGFKNNVRSFVYVVSTGACNGTWRVRFTISTSLFDVRDMHIAEPDNWEKLLDDLDAAGDARHQEACAYFNRDKDEYCCTSCPGGKDGCVLIAIRDIASRIRKLRGEGDA